MGVDDLRVNGDWKRHSGHPVCGLVCGDKVDQVVQEFIIRAIDDQRRAGLEGQVNDGQFTDRFQGVGTGYAVIG